jgi:hypothetical protein
MAHARIGRVRMKEGGAEIVPLRLVSVGDGFRFDPDKLLAGAMGQGFTNLVILAEQADDDKLYIASMANAGEAMVMIERAKLQIIERD